MTRHMTIACIAALSISSASFAQNPPDAATLINTSIANAEQNAKAALAYTFHENYVISMTSDADSMSSSTMGGGGPGSSAIATATRSATGVRPSSGTAGGGGETSTQYDVFFIEGIPYRRVVGVNHDPLTPESAAAESNRYDAAVAAVHAMSNEQRMEMLKGGNSLAVDPKQLTTMYDCKIAGHDKVRKRPATVVQCKLRNDLPAQSNANATPMSKEIKLWIDDEQPFFVKTRATLNRTIDKYRRFTTVTIQWTLIDGVWHQTSTEADWVGLNDPKSEQGKITDTFSDFKRFRTESTILPDYPSDLPLPPQP
jgi:hypothetical protein